LHISLSSCGRTLSAEQIDSREIDNFITAPIEDRFHHEKTEALCLLISDGWRHGKFLSRDRHLDQCRTVMFQGLRDHRLYVVRGFRFQSEQARSLRNLREVRVA